MLLSQKAILRQNKVLLWANAQKNQTIGEDDDIPLWYYIWLPIIILFIWRSLLCSLAQFLISLLLNNEMAWFCVHCSAWISFDIIVYVYFELSDLLVVAIFQFHGQMIMVKFLHLCSRITFISVKVQ